MNTEIYEEILRQAYQPDMATSKAGDPGFTERAENLSDHLYRLCIEFGVAFNDFKSRMLDEILNCSRLHRGDANADQGGDHLPRFLAPAQDNIPMLVFALELMREDSEF